MSFVAASNTVRFEVFNQAVTANTNILSSDITFTNQPASIGFIYIIPVLAGSLTIRYTKFGQTVTGTFAAEVANTPNFHFIEASFKETLNFQYSISTTLSKFVVAEIVPYTSSS